MLTFAICAGAILAGAAMTAPVMWWLCDLDEAELHGGRVIW